MEQLILVLAIFLPVAIFWAWMLSDMTNNDDLGPCFISITGGRDPKLDWGFAFFFLNVFTALLYYTTEYRRRH